MIFFFIFSGLDIDCTDIINEDVQKRILDEIEDIKKNDLSLCLGQLSVDLECKPVLCAKPTTFKSWDHLGKWLLKIYDHMFENYDHSVSRIRMYLIKIVFHKMCAVLHFFYNFSCITWIFISLLVLCCLCPALNMYFRGGLQRWFTWYGF